MSTCSRDRTFDLLLCMFMYMISEKQRRQQRDEAFVQALQCLAQTMQAQAKQLETFQTAMIDGTHKLAQDLIGLHEKSQHEPEGMETASCSCS